MKVLIAGGGTGGHLMPALAMGAELTRRRPDVEPVYVGATRGIEATVLPARGVKHYLLPAEPLYRRTWWRNARWPLVLWRVMRACQHILDTEHPVLAIGTGGYAAGPILWSASRRGIPLVLQEANAYPGIATRWLAGRARQVFLGFPEAARHLHPGPATEVFTPGSPIVPPTDAPDRAAARRQLGLAADARVVLVMGGSQGARGINRALAAALEQHRLDGAQVLWSTGAGLWESYRRFDQPPGRQVRPFWDPIGPAYAAADLVVARSGAMTLAELCAFGLPSILIPLPTSAANHQNANAMALEGAGAAVRLPEADLTPASLADPIVSLLGDPKRLATMRENALRRGNAGAAQQIVERILTLLPAATGNS